MRIWYQALVVVLIAFVVYSLLSLIIYRGEFSPIHYYSFDSLKECEGEGALVSDNLEMLIEGDSLKQIKDLNGKFYLCKSMYERFYGFLLNTKHEDKNLRRLKWEEPLELAATRNWIIVMDNEYIGGAFYSGFLDAKIGDTVLLEVKK